MSYRQRQAFICLLALAAIACATSAFATTPQQYDLALAEVQSALVKESRSTSAAGARGSSAALANRVLGPIASVQAPGGPPQPVDNTLLLQSIQDASGEINAKQRATALEAASRKIEHLRHQIVMTGRDSESSKGLAMASVAKSILATDVFGSDPVPPRSAMERFLDWVGRELGILWKHLTASHSRSPEIPSISMPFIKTLLILLVVGAFVLLVFILIKALRHRNVRPAPLALDETEASLVEARDTDSLRALGDEHARRGDYRMAFRLVYLATLVALDTGGVLRFDRSKTNWEYLRALRSTGRTDVYDRMAPLTRDFDRFWYGTAVAQQSDYANAVSQYDSVVRPGQQTAALSAESV